MSAKPEKKSTTSWADEAEDEEPVAQPKPVWAKMHNWGATAPGSAAAPPKGNYDKNFPPPGKDDFPPPSSTSTSSAPSSSKGASQRPAQQQQQYQQQGPSSSASSAPRASRQESDDFRGPSVPSTSSTSQERQHREYTPREYPARAEGGASYPPRERNEEGGSYRRNDDREGGSSYNRRGGDDHRGRRGDDDRRGGERRFDNRGGERRDYGRESADRRDEREGFHAVGRRGDHGNHPRDFDRHDDRNQDREGGDSNRRGGRSFGFDNRRDNNNEREERPTFERREREVVPFPEAAPFTCFLANLSYEVNQTQLTEFFEGKGYKIENVKVPAGLEGASNKGYAYIEFSDLEDLKKAVESSGTTIGGRSVKISVAEPQKERPKLNLNPRSVTNQSEDSKKAETEGKSNPFGAAKPRDELAILQKKEEERKLREEKLREEKEKERPSEDSEQKTDAPSESPKDSSDSTAEKPKREDQKLYVAKKEGSGSGYKDQRGGKRNDNREPREPREPRETREPREGGERKTFDKNEPREAREPREPREPRADGKPFERSERGGFRGRGGFERGRKEGSRGGRGGFNAGGDRPHKKEEGPRTSNLTKEQQAESFKASHANPFDALGEDEE